MWGNFILSADKSKQYFVLLASMNLGSTAVIIGGAVAGVVVLGIVVYCCCCRKGKNEEPAEGYVPYSILEASALLTTI